MKNKILNRMFNAVSARYGLEASETINFARLMENKSVPLKDFARVYNTLMKKEELK